MSQKPRNLTDAGKLSAQAIEELDWILTEEETEQLCWIVGFVREHKDDMLPCQSKDQHELYSEIAKTAKTLENLLSACGAQKILNYVDYASRIASHYQGRAEDADPQGKPTPRKVVHYRLAEMLCAAIGDGRLPIEMRSHPDSDLAQIFRLCCREVGISEPKNAAHYLAGAIKSAKLEQEEISRRQQVHDLAAKKIREGKDGRDWDQVISEYLEEADRIQKGAK